MKTNAKERREMHYQYSKQGEDKDVVRLIADVDDARGLLGVVLEEIKNGEIETNYSQRVCAKSIANFLKEPKR